MLKDGKRVKDIHIPAKKMCPIFKLVCQQAKCMFYNEEAKDCYLITLAKKIPE